jgi:membrane protease YdiL (CAAX protease family)
MTGHRPLSASEETAVVAAQLAALVVGGLFLLPAIRRLSWRAWVGDSGLKAASITIVIWALFIAFGLWASSQTGHRGDSIHSTLHDRSVATLVAASKHIGGTGLAMLMVAILVPMYEELVFRGFVLGGLSRHLSFGWSNTWQALLFAFLHFDFPHFAFYFALGLMAGWLVRRTNGLAASMALHAVNNAIACAAILLLGS